MKFCKIHQKCFISCLRFKCKAAATCIQLNAEALIKFQFQRNMESLKLKIILVVSVKILTLTRAHMKNVVNMQNLNYFTTSVIGTRYFEKIANIKDITEDMLDINVSSTVTSIHSYNY